MPARHWARVHLAAPSRPAKLALLVLAFLALAGLPPASAQASLPQYGLWRVQNGPALTFGAYPSQILVTDTSVVVSGSGWDSIELTRGYYVDEVRNARVDPLLFDSLHVYNYNSDERETLARSTNGALLVLRTKSYETYTPGLRFGRATTFAEVFHRPNPAAPLQHAVADSVSALPPPPREVLLKGLRISDIGASAKSGDTIRYAYLFKNFALDTGGVEVRDLVHDTAAGARKAGAPVHLETSGTLRLGAGGASPFGAWRQGDTLAVIWREGGAPERSRFTVRRFDLRTGARLQGDPGAYRVGGETVPKISVDERHGRAFDSGIDYTLGAGGSYWPHPDITALDARTGTAIWHRSLPVAEGWETDGFLTAARPSASGATVAVAFDRLQRFGPGAYDYDYRIEVQGIDAATGDSLWTTVLALDTFQNRAHGLTPTDIAARADGGYVVAGWVAERSIDPVRDLRYAYTALFFLDSVGCLTPGCRETSAAGELPIVSYEVQLAPNPVAPGATLRVSLGGAASLAGGRYVYAITDAAGRTLAIGSEIADDPEGGLIVTLPTGLQPGAHFLTLRSLDQVASMVCKAFVVQAP